MKIYGIIAEYNPFHKGHAYQIDYCRQQGADAIIIVMSGNYVQRGEPACLDKYIRTRMALECGADLVLELPVGYATSSAEHFAYAGVSLLEQLGCVTHICYGCEHPDVISKVAPRMANLINLEKEPKEYSMLLQQHLKSGLSYASSRLHACMEYFNLPSEYESILQQPNNTLALAYEIAKYQLNSSILSVPLKRQGAGYHESVTSNCDNHFPSATGIREQIALHQKQSQHNNFKTEHFFNFLQQSLPKPCIPLFEKYYQMIFPIGPNDFSNYFLQTICQYQLQNNIPKTLDMTPELWDIIIKHAQNYTDYNIFTEKCSSRVYPASRIRRTVLHLLLQIRSDDVTNQLTNGCHSYIRPLGFHKASSQILSLIKKQSHLPIISKLADYEKILTAFAEEHSEYTQLDIARQMIQQEFYADELYRYIIQTKFQNIVPNSFSQSLVLI